MKHSPKSPTLAAYALVLATTTCVAVPAMASIQPPPPPPACYCSGSVYEDGGIFVCYMKCTNGNSSEEDEPSGTPIIDSDSVCQGYVNTFAWQQSPACKALTVSTPSPD